MKKSLLSSVAMLALTMVLTAQESVVLPPNVRPLLPDGTEAVVTYLDENIQSRTREAQPMIKCNGKLYFVATNATYGEELWISDGTPEGTKILKDINPGTGNSSPKWLTAVANKRVFFSADNGTTGAELWVTDGTEEGTVLVKDIYEGSTASAPQAITAFGERVLFFALDEESEWTPVIDSKIAEKWLWISNGTEEGTERIGDTPTKLDCDGTRGAIVVVNGKGIFAGYDKINNETIWATDGTPDGTAPLININPRKDTTAVSVFETEAASIDHLVAIDGRLAAFRAVAVTEVTGADIDWGVEMWITDGTTTGTKQIGFPINKLEKDGKYSSSDFRQTYPIGDHLYFRANNGNKAVNGAEPWVYYIDQPIQEGKNPRMIQDCAHHKNVMYYNCHPSCFYEYKDVMYMAGNFTYNIEEFNADSGKVITRSWDSGYHTLCRAKISEIEEGAENPIQGEYMWTGFEIFPGGQPFTHKFCTANDTCFFVCRDVSSPNNYELWKMDSKVAGSAEFDKPVKVMDLPDDGQICYPIQMFQHLYFASATQKQIYQYQMNNRIVDIDEEDLGTPDAIDNTRIEDPNMVKKMFVPDYGVVIIKNGTRFNTLGQEL